MKINKKLPNRCFKTYEEYMISQLRKLSFAKGYLTTVLEESIKEKDSPEVTKQLLTDAVELIYKALEAKRND